MIYILGQHQWQLEKQIKDAWRYYKVRSGDCHTIAARVNNRRRAGVPFAYPEEIAKYDTYARELKEVEEYIALRQKELNRKNPKLRQENKTFNMKQIERLRNELTV